MNPDAWRTFRRCKSSISKMECLLWENFADEARVLVDCLRNRSWHILRTRYRGNCRTNLQEILMQVEVPKLVCKMEYNATSRCLRRILLDFLCKLRRSAQLDMVHKGKLPICPWQSRKFHLPTTNDYRILYRETMILKPLPRCI